MANEFNAKGRRMVFEEDIEKIGQGGGSEYTAGTGITITDSTISVDTETVAMKTDLNGFVDTSTNQSVGGQKTFTDTTSVVYQTGGTSGGTTLYNGAVGVVFGTAQGLLQPDNLTLSGTSTPYVTSGVVGQTSGRYNLPAGKTGDVALTSEIAHFTDFVDMTNKSTVTADEYNDILNGKKRVKYDAQVYEISWIITEPDWSGFTGIRLESSAPGMIKLDTNSVGKVNAVIWAPGTAHEYEFERNEDAYVKANTGDTPGYTLTDIKVGDNVYSIATGTTVVANSTATPSATLTTLQVGTDTYEVPQGGGSSYTAGTAMSITSDTLNVGSKSDTDRVSLLSVSGGVRSPGQPTTTGNGTLKIGYLSQQETRPDNSGVISLFNHGRTEGDEYNSGIEFLTAYGADPYSVKAKISFALGDITIDDPSGSINLNTYNSGAKLNLFGSRANVDMRIAFGGNSKTVYVPLSDNGTLALRSDIKNTIPECPTTTDGTYVLEATVSSGVVTYNWVLKV